MDITACVARDCSERHSCYRYMGKRGQHQSFSNLKITGTCDKIQIGSGDRVYTPSEADEVNAQLEEEFYYHCCDSI